MVTERQPRTLPGTDAMRFQRYSLILYLGVCTIFLAMSMAIATEVGAQGVHLPWPIAQWALVTPLGTLATALVGGLLSGLPIGLTSRAGLGLTYAVDVTEVPLAAWSGHALWPRRRRGAPLPAGDVPNRSLGQQLLSILARALAVLLLLGFFATYVAVAWYGITHFPDCVGSRCPPSFGYIQWSPIVLGLAIMFVSQYAWIRYVERRCGIWFRVPTGARADFTYYYIRRPGVTTEDAAAALARYSRGAERPPGFRALEFALLSAPYFLVQIALALLAAWLPTQWPFS
jgi:hypothetical protein